MQTKQSKQSKQQAHNKVERQDSRRDDKLHGDRLRDEKLHSDRLHNDKLHGNPVNVAQKHAGDSRGFNKNSKTGVNTTSKPNGKENNKVKSGNVRIGESAADVIGKFLGYVAAFVSFFIGKINAIFIKSDFGRIRIAIVLFVVAFVAMQAEIAWTFLSNSRQVELRDAKPYSMFFNKKRLDIVDRNGVLIATNIAASNLYVQASQMVDIEGDVDKLCDIFPSIVDSRDKLIEEIYEKKDNLNSWVLIKQKILKEDKQKVIDSGVIGVQFEPRQVRVYPHNNIASHILGFVSVDNVGVAGIEKRFDKYLSMQDKRGKTVNRDLYCVEDNFFDDEEYEQYGSMESAKSDSKYSSSSKGDKAGKSNKININATRAEKCVQKLRLSIDINLQGIVRGVLSRAVKKYDARYAFAVIMDVETGEVVSAVSLPDFNPNNVGAYKEDNRFNRFSLGVYELGSVFKIFPSALAIESGISLSKTYDTSTNLVIGDHTIHDYGHRNPFAKMNLPEILRRSSNIGIGRMVLEDVGGDALREMYERLGFFDKLDVELPERGNPILPTRWNKIQTVTASYGHGISITPLHFVRAVAAIANSGVTVMPTFLKVNKKEDIQYGETVVTPATSKKTSTLLRLVVTDGTGKKALTDRYDVGGKSGTADKVIKGKYDSKQVLVSFVAIVPTSKPKYLFYMGIGEPYSTTKVKVGNNGGTIVAPIISEIIASAGPILNIPMLK